MLPTTALGSTLIPMIRLLKTGFGPVPLGEVVMLILVLIFRYPKLIHVQSSIVILRKEGLGGIGVLLLVQVHRLDHTPGPLASDPSQLGPYLLSDIGIPPSQFKKPKTPPPRTVVATTRMEMYTRHTGTPARMWLLPLHQVTVTVHPHPPLLVHGFLVHLRLLHGPAFNNGWMRLIPRLLHQLQPYLSLNQCLCTQVSLLLCHLGTLPLRWRPTGSVVLVETRCYEGHALVIHRLWSCKG